MWLLSPAAMTTIPTDLEKRTTSMKITVNNVEDRHLFLQNGI